MQRLALLLIALSAAAQILNPPIASDAAQTTPGERLTLLTAVCGASAADHGCDKCPPGTEFPKSRLDLEGVIYGHFLSPSSNDAAVGFFGCESHASGLGGTALLSREGNGWRLISIRPGVIADDCKKLRAPDGRDVLICFGGDLHFGISDQFLYLADFQSGGESETLGGTFFRVNDSASSCESILMPQKGPVSGAITKVLFAAPDRITIEARLGSITPEEFQPLEPDCAYGKPGLPGLRLATVTRTYRFRFDGSRVVPVPGNPEMIGDTAIAPETRVLK